jgi:hypothetical protein
LEFQSPFKPNELFSIFEKNVTSFVIKQGVLVLCFPYFANIFIMILKKNVRTCLKVWELISHSKAKQYTPLAEETLCCMWLHHLAFKIFLTVVTSVVLVYICQGYI